MSYPERPTFLIRQHEVLKRCAISKSTLRRLCEAGEFPRPIKLGARAIAWVEGDIEDWIQQRIAESKGE